MFSATCQTNCQAPDAHAQGRKKVPAPVPPAQGRKKVEAPVPARSVRGPPGNLCGAFWGRLEMHNYLQGDVVHDEAQCRLDPVHHRLTMGSVGAVVPFANDSNRLVGICRRQVRVVLQSSELGGLRALRLTASSAASYCTDACA